VNNRIPYHSRSAAGRLSGNIPSYSSRRSYVCSPYLSLTLQSIVLHSHPSVKATHRLARCSDFHDGAVVAADRDFWVVACAAALATSYLLSIGRASESGVLGVEFLNQHTAGFDSVLASPTGRTNSTKIPACPKGRKAVHRLEILGPKVNGLTWFS